MRPRPRKGKDGKASDYEVGYGKPPTERQFKPGQSGNPRGRPKNRRNFKTVLHQALAERVTIVEGGVRRRVSKREAFVYRVLNNALTGDPNDRAVGQSASAIILQGVDPYTIKASISDAKRAGIPVVSVAALPAGPVASELVDAGVNASVQFSFDEIARALAAYIAANSKESGAHVGLIGSSTFRTDPFFLAAFTEELARLCPKCEVAQKDSPLMQWQTLPALTRTMITVDPELDYIVPVVDAMVPGIKSAIVAAGAGDRVKIVTANASLPDMQAIATKTDQEVANIGASNERMGWAAVDQVARILSGKDPVVESQPLRLFTTDNIGEVDLSKPAGEWYGFDYKGFYRGIWGL